MRLTVGERLEGAGPAQQPGGYVVTSVIRETPWHGLYAGKKIFYNFDFTAKRVRETDEVEWLDVFLRTNRYPILDDLAYVQQRRALARAEVRAILGNRRSNLWPEPLDLLEIENTRDPFTFSSDGVRGQEPVVIYARPQGRFTFDWQKQILPVTSILSVLAELLEFMKQAHAEGLLLLGLGPASLLIDASDRVHYVGTELVLAQSSGLLKEAMTSSAQWSRLFPADRFARGYAAPECFDPANRPDARADLYAWGALAYSLLVGADLTKAAQEQGGLWITFNDAHWTQLEKLLAQLPASSIHGWAEQVGVDPRALVEGWPRKFLAVFRSLLSPDPARRPRSVADLLSWLIDPPPPPLAGLVALHTGGDVAKLLLDCTGVDQGLEMAIQSARVAPARSPSEGTTILEGPVRPIVAISQLPVTDEPIFFTVFTRRTEAGRRAYSSGVAAELWQPSEANLRKWVEERAANTVEGQQIPIQVGLVLGAVDLSTVIGGLLASSSIRVRSWGLRRVEQVVRSQPYNQANESLLWRCLSDPNVELRQSAAAALWAWHPRQTDELLLRLVSTLETPPIDAPVPIVHFLRHLGLPEDRIRTLLENLEARQPTECPLCKKPLTLGERGTHLQAEHGYRIYQGDLLPVQVVLSRLWQRVFEQQDRNAHEELVGVYQTMPGVRREQDAVIESYVADLQRFLLGAPPNPGAASRGVGEIAGIPVAMPYAAMVAYQANLRGSHSFLTIARVLLRAAAPRLREIGMQTVLPYFHDQFRTHARVDDLRRLLTQVCPDLDQTDIQIELCRQLGQFGVDSSVVSECVEQLQEERLLVCPECGSNVRTKDIELHLRRAHQIFEFRGKRRPYAETRDAILRAVCTPPTDAAAWKSLRSLAEDKHTGEADRFLVVWLSQFIKDVEAEQRNTCIAVLAEVLAAVQAGARLLPLFAGPSKNASWELLGQRIALEICTRLTGPLPAALVHQVTPFLDQKELPRRSRENAVMALLRAAGKDSGMAAIVLRAFVAHTSKKRGVQKLQQLEHRFGHSVTIDAVAKELDDEIRMSCPRCPTELKKKDMVGHLWEKHRLILDGQRVREPWRVIDDWVIDYGLEKDPQILQRCRELAVRDDPHAGLARLQRALFRRGLRERELLGELRTQVKARNATLCPNCSATVPIENPPIVQPLKLEAARLAGYGYLLEVSERGLFPSLVIESPEAIEFRGREPGRGLTRLGTLCLLIGPMCVALYPLVDLATGEDLPAVLLWTIAVGAGLFVTGLLYLAWPSPRPVKDRLVNAAWQILVPEMLKEELGPRGWGFLHGLVEITEEVRGQAIHEDLLLECCEDASDAAREDPLARACLARLGRRYLADLADRGEDPFEFVLTLAGECFKGKLPLSFLGDLLRNFHGTTRSMWSNADVNRLPILIANYAFGVDIGTDDWLNLGRALPIVGDVLHLEQRWHWLQFFALWAQRGRKPWEAVGDAVTMVDLARAPAKYEEILTHYPDVLLYVPKASLVIGSKGVWIEGVCVTSFPAGADVSLQKISGHFELTVGAIKIRCADNPRAYLDDIKSWLRYYFQSFLPTVASPVRPAFESTHRMWQLSRVACPECGKPLVPCLGDLGVALR